jgi:2-polyprenyl-3-methyl-5-hydroxy-6-metoxy-1,4-benzoquinol methylase
MNEPSSNLAPDHAHPEQEQAGHAFNETYFHSGPYASVSFRKYSQYWWSNRFYASLALKHAPRIKKTLPAPAPSDSHSQPRALEIGCGLGHLLTWLVDRFAVYGSDINEWALQQARINVPQGQFDQLSAEDLGLYPDAHFHIVIAKHVVEHLPHPELAIQEMTRVLAPGGLLVLATPNLDSPMRPWKKGKWIGYQDKTHISLKPPAEWLALLRRHSLQPFKVFSDGFWDAPYLPLLPTPLQKILFGLPGGLQAVFGWSIIPVKLGESLIVLAKRI